ncbi:MAG: Mbov_0395 family pilin-like conjugal transfer protein, partial [Minisyncoccia bacterium]
GVCQVDTSIVNPGTGGTTALPSGSTANSGSPLSGSGFPSPNTAPLTGYTNAIISFINSALVPVLIAIAFIVFLWGIVRAYFLNGGDETARKEGHQLILWGIIGFVVIFSVWGLVNLVNSTLNLGGGVAPPSPGAPQSSASKTTTPAP